MVFGGVLKQLSQLQGVFTDLLDRREQETRNGNVDHLLEEPAGLEEMLIFAQLHEALQLSTGCWMSVTVVGVDRETFSLQEKKRRTFQRHFRSAESGE